MCKVGQYYHKTNQKTRSVGAIAALFSFLQRRRDRAVLSKAVMQRKLFPWLQPHLAIPETVLAVRPDRPMLTALATAFPFFLQKFSISFLSLLNVFISLLPKYKKT